MEQVVHELDSDEGKFYRRSMLHIPGSKDRSTNIKKTSHGWRVGNTEMWIHNGAQSLSQHLSQSQASCLLYSTLLSTDAPAHRNQWQV